MRVRITHSIRNNTGCSIWKLLARNFFKRILKHVLDSSTRGWKCTISVLELSSVEQFQMEHTVVSSGIASTELVLEVTQAQLNSLYNFQNSGFWHFWLVLDFTKKLKPLFKFMLVFDPILWKYCPWEMFGSCFSSNNPNFGFVNEKYWFVSIVHSIAWKCSYAQLFWR